MPLTANAAVSLVSAKLQDEEKEGVQRERRDLAEDGGIIVDGRCCFWSQIFRIIPRFVFFLGLGDAGSMPYEKEKW